MIAENIREVQENIRRACLKAGRSPEEVTLIAVSKTKPVSMLKEAYDAGAHIFGENKVQEIVEKYDQLPGEVSWHMIGHLQTNKVRPLMGRACMIHSVDSLHLAQTIEKEAARSQLVMPVLIEVNAAEEESKFGVSVSDALPLIEKIAAFPHIRVQGLMTIAPYTEDPEQNRDFFRQLKKLSVDIAGKNINNVSMNVLSMGMTGDYMVAIEEGATMVRVGTGIFGAREYHLN